MRNKLIDDINRYIVYLNNQGLDISVHGKDGLAPSNVVGNGTANKYLAKFLQGFFVPDQNVVEQQRLGLRFLQVFL